jgi:hypothetical protein
LAFEANNKMGTSDIYQLMIPTISPILWLNTSSKHPSAIKPAFFAAVMAKMAWP